MRIFFLLLPGLLVLAIAWTGLALRPAATSFALHMAVHLAVVAIAAPLLALGLAAARLRPRRRWPALFAPVPASLVELVVVWGWHAPALHAAARASGPVMLLEQASFLTAGLMLWGSALTSAGPASTGRDAQGVIGLLLTSMHMTLLGALLALSPRPLYDPAICGFGSLSPLADQHLGGAMMLTVGGASYLIGGLYLMARLLRTPAPEQGTP